MKSIIYSAIATAIAASSFGVSAQKAVVYLKNGQTIEYKAQELDFIQFIEDEENPVIDNIITEEYIPDPYFRQYVKDVIVNGADELSSEAAAAFTGTIDLSLGAYWDVASFEGMEFFPNTTTLNINYTNAPAEGLAPMPGLKNFRCSGSKVDVKTFDFASYFPSLDYLDISNNTVDGDLTLALDNITKLECYRCQLKSLDVSGCPNLNSLSASYNNLTSLNLGESKISFLFIQENPNLGTVDLSGLKTNLQELNISNSGIKTLDLAGLTNLTWLECQANSFTTTPNFNECINLQNLRCEDSGITTIDVSALKNLEELHCYNNALTELNISNLPKLRMVNAFNNKLTSVNTDGCDAIYMLSIYNNELTSLEVNSPSVVNVYAANNKLSTVSVQDCPLLSQLDLGSNNLSELTLENLPSLGLFYADRNLITSVSLKNLPMLNYFDLSTNKLSRLDVTSLDQEILTGLACGSNEKNMEIKVWENMSLDQTPAGWSIGTATLVHEFTEE